MQSRSLPLAPVRCGTLVHIETPRFTTRPRIDAYVIRTLPLEHCCSDTAARALLLGHCSNTAARTLLLQHCRSHAASQH